MLHIVIGGSVIFCQNDAIKLTRV